jgi:hypothetical protein
MYVTVDILKRFSNAEVSTDEIWKSTKRCNDRTCLNELGDDFTGSSERITFLDKNKSKKQILGDESQNSDVEKNLICERDVKNVVSVW